jgi:ribosomal protein L30/L7E
MIASGKGKEPIPINAPNKLVLSDGERNHPLWLRIEADLKRHLEALRLRNDRVLLEAETAELRGRIAEVKRLINLGREPQVIE